MTGGAAGWALLAGWATSSLIATYAVHRYWRLVARALSAPEAAGAVVIVPVRGAPGQEARLADFLQRCAAQEGASYRMVFAVESERDPAFGPIAAFVARDRRARLVVAGRAATRGQKVHNQLAALATLTPDDRFVAFADCDVLLPPDWLSQLLRPLLLGAAEVSSGYRWIVPADDRLASRLCALADWSVATAGRSRRWNLCWGGSMALTRAALDRIDLPRVWAESVLDDLVLTRAARTAGMTVHAPHRVLAASPAGHDAASLLDFGRRQHLFVRVHAPWHWRVAGLALAVPAAGGALAVAGALDGSVAAMAWLSAAAALQQLRAQLRLGVARRVLPAAEAERSAALLRRDRWLLPAAHLAHLAIWLASASGRTMTWGGRRYRLTAPGRVEVLD